MEEDAGFSSARGPIEELKDDKGVDDSDRQDVRTEQAMVDGGMDHGRSMKVSARAANDIKAAETKEESKAN